VDKEAVYSMSRDQVTQMNLHLGEALKLIEAGAAENNAGIREHMKQFFHIAEEIEREVAKREVFSLQKVKANELRAIEFQKEQVDAFISHFDEQIAAIEARIRAALDQTVPLLNC
jgi:hypothetical protein